MLFEVVFAVNFALLILLFSVLHCKTIFLINRLSSLSSYIFTNIHALPLFCYLSLSFLLGLDSKHLTICASVSFFVSRKFFFAPLLLLIEVLTEGHLNLALLDKLIPLHSLLFFVLMLHDGAPFVKDLLLTSDWQMSLLKG